jgi:hypothetical protein
VRYDERGQVWEGDGFVACLKGSRHPNDRGLGDRGEA